MKRVYARKGFSEIMRFKKLETRLRSYLLVLFWLNWLLFFFRLVKHYFHKKSRNFKRFFFFSRSFCFLQEKVLFLLRAPRSLIYNF